MTIQPVPSRSFSPRVKGERYRVQVADAPDAAGVPAPRVAVTTRMKTYEGKTALITGGSSGIGLAIAKLLAKEGAHVWLLARDPVKLETACHEVQDARKNPTQQVMTIIADVASYNQLSAVLQPILKDSGTPDLLVNSAGITYPGEFKDLNLEIFTQNMDVNFYGTLNTIKLVVPGMIERKSGAIVNISSAMGVHSIYGYSAYGPSKFAVTGLSESLHYELKEYGIQVSVAFPTDTDTPQLAFEKSLKPPLLRALTEVGNTVVPAETVARNILRDVQKGRCYILPTTDMKMLYFVYRLLPGDSFFIFVDYMTHLARRKLAKENNGH